MSTVGRPRANHVARTMQECAKHGLTEFSRYINGDGPGGYFWRCMACQRERAKARHLHPSNTHRTKKHVESPGVCPECFLQIPLSGVCGCVEITTKQGEPA